ncbi:energy-coupling factor transporter transmembrane component T family protein [Corynebacterium mendelii]|uniref:Energy-coupling factor transporter transmembrane protein EcfT n=1 Tax=Corynebacterium mendelii TaxID=2765362 RepID=A0A939E0I4_9CORY|nr:energy-coupling factor transporter transmembrane protein EcfT [Corynebacterium mendelii]MBN9643302.1 energy-coupling factor transporter transmembrane protein EcfT [Corynebacterium mendelii]
MVREIPLGVYVDKDSVIHRLPAGWKCVAVFVFIIASNVICHTFWHGLICVALAASGYVLAKIPPLTAWRQVWPVLPFIALISVMMVFAKGIDATATTALVLLSNIIAATVMTLTVRVSEMMDLLDTSLAPLERFGFPAAHISLAVSLTIRLIPLQLATVNDVLDARKARGLGASPAAFGTPVIIRSIRRAEHIADALTARGAVD